MYNTLYKSGPLYSTEENVEQVQSLPRSLHKPSTTTASCSSEGGGDYCPGCHGHSTGVSSRVSAMWLLPTSKSHDFHNIIGGDSVQVYTLTHQISPPSPRFWQCQDIESAWLHYLPPKLYYQHLSVNLSDKIQCCAKLCCLKSPLALMRKRGDFILL